MKSERILVRVLVSQDQVNRQSILNDVFSFGVGNFVGDTDFHVAIWFVFHTVSTRHDIVPFHANRSQVEQVESFDRGSELISIGQPVVPVRFREDVEPTVTQFSV